MSRRILFLGLLLISLGSSSAAPPAWWAVRGATDASPPNDDAVVNQGQLKLFTQKALQEFNARIPGGAGPDLIGVVNGWVQAYQAGGYNAANPLPADFAAVNTGQLKWIANKIHSRLVFVKYEDAPPAWLVQNPATDRQLVNLGQLKTVFNFDLSAPPGQLPVWWQKFYFNGQTNIAPSGDADNDGTTNLNEYLNGTNPNDPVVNSDSDGDGLVDSWEILHFSNLAQTRDGDPDNDGLTNFQEQSMGTNPNAVGADGNTNGIPDDWELANAGTFAVYPPVLKASLDHNQTAQTPIYFLNDTGTAVNYTLNVTDNAVLDNSSTRYSYKDSLTGGMPFVWEDVSTTGTLLEAVSNSDEGSQAFDIVGFTFPFYGQNFSRVYVQANGVLTFDETRSAGWFNQTLPFYTLGAAICPFWDDLNTSVSGDIYAKQENDRLIIQYQNVARYRGSSANTYTFQVVLFADGRVQLRYQTLTGITNSCTVGVQDSTQYLALQIVKNSNYLTNQLAIEIWPNSEFFKITTLTGSVPAHSVETATGHFLSLKLSPAVYTANVAVTHDGPGTNPKNLPVRLEVKDHPASITFTAPTSGQTIIYGQYLDLAVTASDPDGIERVEFYDGQVRIGSAAITGTQYSLRYLSPPAGSRQITARVVDNYWGSTVSIPVNVNVIANPPSEIALVHPTSGGSSEQWSPLQILANATHLLGVVKVQFYDNGILLGEDSSPPYSFQAQKLAVRNHIFTATAVDTFGFPTTSLPVSYTILDGDGMPDDWEIANGLNPLADDSLDDLDGDRVPNIFEYYYGTRPNDASDYPAPTFEVNHATGDSDPNDAIFPSITSALAAAALRDEDSDGQPDPYVMILVHSGEYREDVGLTGVPVLMLGELAGTDGPVRISPDATGAAITIESPSVVDGFVISHQDAVNGRGVETSATIADSTGKRRLVNCIVRNNSAGTAAGISATNCDLTLIHCTVIGNYSITSAPGVGLYGADLHMCNSVIAGNHAPYGVAINQIEVGAGSSVSASGSAPSLVGDYPLAPISGWIRMDPLLATDGFADAYSKVLDSGGNMVSTKVLFDIQGQQRPEGNAVDIGADEFVPTYPSDEDDGPGVNPNIIDSDGDGIPDQWEIAHGLNPEVPNPAANFQTYLNSRDTSGELQVHTPLLITP